MKTDHITSKNQGLTPENDPSNRPSLRSEFEVAEASEGCAKADAFGSDSIPFLGIPFATGEPLVHSKKKKLRRKHLAELEDKLTARDRAVMEALRKYRFLTSSQVGRIFFSECSTATSRTRNQNLLLKRLSDYGLIQALERRIGGFGGGSSVQIWHLTEAGYRLLMLDDPDTFRRKRFVEPSTLFIEHTLAISECAVQLHSICRYSHDLNLEVVDTEPSCWRRYNDDGQVVQLKPDMFAVTTCEGVDEKRYEDRWFVEMDLGTEAPRQVMEKCDAYLRYYYTGIEQNETGMFPLVLWIVKDEARKTRLKEYIRESIKAQPQMFLVITPDELERVIRGKIDPKELC